jgi:hypothetical protein
VSARPRPPERDYSGRDVIDKLGVKLGYVVAFDEAAGSLDAELKQRILDRAASDVSDEEPIDVVLALADATVDLTALLARWKVRIRPNGGIWVLTPKRKEPGYIGDGPLIAAGGEAGLVDNKVCSVSDTISGMRFVIRRADRPPGRR